MKAYRVLGMAAVAGLVAGVCSAAAETYGVDPVHSTANFRIKHMGTSYFYGRFNDISGTIKFDEADPTKSSFDVDVKTESVDTKNDGRDKHLKSDSFFNVKQYPKMTFKSKSVKKTGEDQYEVSGDFTLHGVTKPLTVKVERTGTGNMRGKQIVGFETSFTLKRTEFGMSEMLDGLSDEVQVTVSLEAGKK
ncbi:MAG TPA: YceI family protein [Phycisphaerae bacterium]